MDAEVRDEDENEIDFSIIRSAIRLKGRMIDQIFSGVHYGSPEVRNLLLNECDIILECKVCRNLFRSLPNLVAHKRVYCNQEYKNYKSRSETVEDCDEIVVVDPCDKDNFNSDTTETTNSTVDKLIDGSFKGTSQAYKFYTKVAEKVDFNKEPCAPSIEFTAIDSNPNAVEQHIIQPSEQGKEEPTKSNSETRTMGRRQKKPAVRKESTLAFKDSADLKLNADKRPPPPMNLRKRVQEDSNNKTSSPSKTPTGKQAKAAVTKESSKAKHLENLKDLKKPAPLSSDQVDLAKKQCLACKEKYTSVRSLRAHIDRMHGKCTKLSYPCPMCDNKFKYLWNVVRHLLLVHKKTKAQVDKMRPKLKKSVVKESSEGKKNKSDEPEVKKDVKKKIKEEKLDEVKTKKDKSSTKVNAKGSRKFKLMVDELDKLKAQTKSSQFKSGGHIHLCEFCQNSFWKEANLLSHIETCLKNPNAAPQEQKQEISLKRKHENDDDDLAEEATPVKKVKSDAAVETDNTNDNSTQQVVEQAIKQMVNVLEEGQLTGPYTTKSKQQRRERLERIEAPLSIEGEVKKEDVYEFAEEDLSVNTVLTDEQKHELGLLDQDSLPCIREVEEIWVDKEPGKPLQKVKSGRAYVLEEKRTSKASCQDQKKIQHIIDEDKLICLKCNQSQTSISNLRRHAVRHLGWKRFECKCCQFTSYNKSEINRHITKCHASQVKKFSLDQLIVDLQEAGEKLRTQKKLQSISEKQFQGMYSPSDFIITYPSKKAANTTYYVCQPNDRKKPGISPENIQEPSLNKFNISTRNSPREFDLRPYQRVDKMETMCTRKGYYPKKTSVSDSSEVKDMDIESEDEEETMSTSATAEPKEPMMAETVENSESNQEVEVEVVEVSNDAEEESSKILKVKSVEENKNELTLQIDNEKTKVKDEWPIVENDEPNEPHMTEANIFYDSGDEAMEHRDDVAGDQDNSKDVELTQVTDDKKCNSNIMETKQQAMHPTTSEINNSQTSEHSSGDRHDEDVNLKSQTGETLISDTKNNDSQDQKCQSKEVENLSNAQKPQSSSKLCESLPACNKPPLDACSDVNTTTASIRAVSSEFVHGDDTVVEKEQVSHLSNLLPAEKQKEETENVNDLPISDAQHVAPSQCVLPANQQGMLVDQPNYNNPHPTENSCQIVDDNNKTITSVSNNISLSADQQAQQLPGSSQVQDVSCYPMNQLQDQVVEEFCQEESAAGYSQNEAVVESEIIHSNNENVAHSSEVDQQFIVDTAAIAGNNNESMFENNSSILIFEIPLSSADNLISSEVHDQQVVPENH